MIRHMEIEALNLGMYLKCEWESSWCRVVKNDSFTTSSDWIVSGYVMHGVAKEAISNYQTMCSQIQMTFMNHDKSCWIDNNDIGDLGLAKQQP